MRENVLALCGGTHGWPDRTHRQEDDLHRHLRERTLRQGEDCHTQRNTARGTLLWHSYYALDYRRCILFRSAKKSLIMKRTTYGRVNSSAHHRYYFLTLDRLVCCNADNKPNKQDDAPEPAWNCQSHDQHGRGAEAFYQAELYPCAGRLSSLWVSILNLTITESIKRKKC